MTTRKTKTLLCFLIIPLCIDMMVACFTPSRNVEGGYYKDKDFYVNNLDNSGRAAFITTSDSVLKQAYGFRLHLIRDKVAGISNPHSFFAQSAIADSPPSYVNGYFPEDTIVSVKIFTIYSFDQIHPANAEVSNCFKVYKNYSFTPVKDYFSNTRWIYSHANDLQLDLDFLLITIPTINTQHQFKIQIKLSDGRTLEQKTTLINLI